MSLNRRGRLVRFVRGLGVVSTIHSSSSGFTVLNTEPALVSGIIGSAVLPAHTDTLNFCD